jgi:chemotaxis protein CheD
MNTKRTLNEVFLQPGDYFVGDAGTRMRTVLGSCVSMTLWHPRKRVGAMSHFLLSQRSKRDVGPRDGRYGDEAMALMREELARRGIAPAECEGKIFGGGDMFPGVARAESLHVGHKNGEAARALLAQHGVKLVSESLYGVGHRQIIFDVRTGYVWVAQVNPVEPAKADLRLVS